MRLEKGSRGVSWRSRKGSIEQTLESPTRKIKAVVGNWGENSIRWGSAWVILLKKGVKSRKGQGKVTGEQILEEKWIKNLQLLSSQSKKVLEGNQGDNPLEKKNIRIRNLH